MRPPPTYGPAEHGAIVALDRGLRFRWHRRKGADIPRSLAWRSFNEARARAPHACKISIPPFCRPVAGLR
jgi:hypothetical protein